MRVVFLSTLFVLVSTLAHAATLGNPGNGLSYSGVGVVSGWKCEAEGDLTIVFNDDGKHIPLLYGTERTDVRMNGQCLDIGHDNVGFVAIWNWANLGEGSHTAVAYDNRKEFARSTFTVATLGEAFVVGASGECTIANFPSTGESATFAWNQNTQHLELVPESVGSADLIIQSPSVSDSTPNTGESFTLRATVRNRGTGSSAATTLRYYRSSNSTIPSGDTQVGTDAVGGLNPSETSPESIAVTAPTSAGTYYYGACVDTVSGESDTTNNCSTGVRVTVQSSGGGSGGGSLGPCSIGLVVGPNQSCTVNDGEIINRGDGCFTFTPFGPGRICAGSSNLNGWVVTRVGNDFRIDDVP